MRSRFHRRGIGASIALALALLLVSLAAPAAQADFGLNEFSLAFSNENGSVATEAGSHPFAVTTSFQFNTRTDPELGLIPDQEAKKLRFQLPAGFAGDPTATPRCAAAEFALTGADGFSHCPDDTAIGLSKTFLNANHIGEMSPVFNLVPAPGTVAKIGFVVHRTPVTVDLGVNSESPNNITAGLINIPQVVYLYGSSLQIWGNPASPIHDPLRGRCLSPQGGPNNEYTSTGVCEANLPDVPFLTLPRSCSGPLITTYEAVSWQSPGVTPVEGATQVPAMEGCSELSFAPSITARTTTPAAESPSGLNFDLEVDDPGLTEVGGRAGSDIEKAIVTLPEGITTNSSVANGLGACTLARYEAEALEFDPAVGCPDNAKVGDVEVTSPLIEETLHGQIYVAKQGENKFHTLLALYMIIRSEQLGILIKQPIKVEPDPRTGRLTTTVEEIPQLPFSDFHLHFFEGSRAPLITPPTCGTYTTTATLYPWDSALAPVQKTASFEVASGTGGRACASSSAQLPNSPSFSAGTTNPAAATYSPFVLHLSREDGSQQLRSISTTLPGGLIGKLAGIPYCPDAQIAQAQGRSGEGQGATELTSPSCPQASEVGTVTVGAGAGTEPLYVTGHAYLAGPYKGAPLSLEIITPAIAGPFDLGVVAVRTALQVDPLTTQITAVSDPIPTILHGLPLDVRSIALDMNRPGFTLNPSSCEPKSITGSATSTLGGVAPLGQYFQASDCGSLKFAPKLQLTLKGQTRRAGHPALKATLTYPKGAGYSNIARAQVSLPHAEFLDQGNLDKVCTQPELKAAACPARSVYGKVKAWTPLLEKPLEGNVYLGVGFGYKLPALVAELGGQIRVLLKGKVDTDKQKGIRNTFEAVPDAPVEKFVLELKGGKKYGLLENSEDICSKPQKAGVVFGAQSGLVENTSVKIADSCDGKGKGKKKKGGKGRR